MKAAFIGYGDLGEQIFHLLQQSESIEAIAYFDDHQVAAGVAGAYPFSSYADEAFREYQFYIGLGYKHLAARNKIAHELLAKGRKVPAMVHSSVYVAPTASIGEGTSVYPMSNIDHNVRIGKACLINNSVVISHDCNMGDSCYISPGVIISGKVSIGENTFIGSGALISNGVNIGANVQIALGTIVTKDVPDNMSVLGNPAHIIARKLNLK